MILNVVLTCSHDSMFPTMGTLIRWKGSINVFYNKQIIFGYYRDINKYIKAWIFLLNNQEEQIVTSIYRKHWATFAQFQVWMENEDLISSVKSHHDRCLSFLTLQGFKLRKRRITNEPTGGTGSCPHLIEAIPCEEPSCYDWRIVRLEECIPDNEKECGPGTQVPQVVCINSDGRLFSQLSVVCSLFIRQSWRFVAEMNEQTWLWFSVFLHFHKGLDVTGCLCFCSSIQNDKLCFELPGVFF